MIAVVISKYSRLSRNLQAQANALERRVKDALHRLRHQAEKQHEFCGGAKGRPQKSKSHAVKKGSPAGGVSSSGAGPSSHRTQGQGLACPVCLEETPEGTLCITSCGHTFCTECIHGLVDKGPGGKCEWGSAHQHIERSPFILSVFLPNPRSCLPS